MGRASNVGRGQSRFTFLMSLFGYYSADCCPACNGKPGTSGVRRPSSHTRPVALRARSPFPDKPLLRRIIGQIPLGHHTAGELQGSAEAFITERFAAASRQEIAKALQCLLAEAVTEWHP